MNLMAKYFKEDCSTYYHPRPRKLKKTKKQVCLASEINLVANNCTMSLQTALYVLLQSQGAAARVAVIHTEALPFHRCFGCGGV